jgi:hypothetical protein
MIIVIGRGNGGTRVISHTLTASGVFMGPTNPQGDLVPPERMYAAARIAGARVRRLGENRWDFSGLMGAPDAVFVEHVRAYIAPVLEAPAALKGFKLPETVLSFPWIAQMFPDAYYIRWTRDPRDCVLSHHPADRLNAFGAPGGAALEIQHARLESWIYHQEIVDAAMRPMRMIEIRFEDFILYNHVERQRLSEFLGFDLTVVPLDPACVNVHRGGRTSVPDEVLRKYGY